MKTVSRVFLFLLAIALAWAGLVACWYAEEDYRGGREWANTRRQLEARGESLDAAHFIPSAVPDDQNLAMAPLFVRLYRYRVDPVTKLLTFGKSSTEIDDSVGGPPYGLTKDSPIQRSKASGSWETGQQLDLAAMQRYYRARPDFPHAPAPQAPADDVLLALTRYAAILDEVDAAVASRPLTRFPINWAQRPAWGISLPHENFVQVLNSTLRLRACAELALGRTDDALRDVTLGLHLCRAIGEEPLIISNLVNVTCLNIELQAIWEGLAGHSWSAAQLTELQARLRKVDLLEDFQRSARGERALFIVPTLTQLHGPNGFGNFYAIQAVRPDEKFWSQWMIFFANAAPRGWADRTVATACQWQQTNVIDCVDVVTHLHRMTTTRIEAGAQDIKTLAPTFANMLAKIIMPVYTSVAIKDARAQAAVDEALTACALERYFLDRRSYPASLEALVPTYLSRLPTDVIDGKHLRYQQTPDNRYRLWEVGWNGRDEGGTVAWNQEGTRLDDKQGDWVWQYTPLAPGGRRTP